MAAAAARKLDINNRKFALISEKMLDELKNARQRSEQIESIEFSKVKELDNKIHDILQNKNLPLGEKLRMYSMVVADYLDSRRRAPEIATREEYVSLPAPIAVHTNKDEEDEEEFKDAEDEEEPPKKKEEPEKAASSSGLNIDEISSETRKEKIGKILSIMKGFENVVSYDRTSREVIINGEKIPNTDISEIFNFVTKRYPPAEDRPSGTTRFLEALANIGVDPKIFPTPNVRTLVQNLQAAKKLSGKGLVTRWVKKRF